MKILHRHLASKQRNSKCPFFSSITGLKWLKDPTLQKGISKYSGYKTQPKDGYTTKSFPHLEGLPRSLLAAAVKASNNSLSNKTWENYEVVKSHLKRCQQTTGERLNFPMGNREVVIFVAYLLSRNNLKAVTIENYLSALRNFHLTEGHFVTNLRPDIIKTMLKGKAKMMQFWTGKRRKGYQSH